jgi:YesN/AraC family two-component response regulator
MGQVLIVDDDPQVCRVITRLLSTNRLAPHSVGSGEAAVAFVKSQTVDAVVLDYQLPGMNGHQVLSALKLHDPSLGVIVLTGFGTIPLAAAAMRLGAFDYLTKPCDNNALLISVGRALEWRRLGGTLENRVLPDLLDHLRKIEGDEFADEESRSAVVARFLRIATSPAVSIPILAVCARALSRIWSEDGRPWREVAGELRKMVEGARELESVPRDPAVGAAVAKLEAAINSHAGVTEEELAREFDLRPQTLGEQVRKTAGLTIPEYKRVGRVRHVLPAVIHTSEHVRQISVRARYAHRTQLDRDFVLTFGVSPSEFRRQIQPHISDGIDSIAPNRGGAAKNIE